MQFHRDSPERRTFNEGLTDESVNTFFKYSGEMLRCTNM